MTRSLEEPNQDSSQPKSQPGNLEVKAADNVKTLLEWLLLAHPDTPKLRAKQWILAGRIRVGGVVQRKPHLRLPDPGATLDLGRRHAATLDCGRGWIIHPRVELLHLDGSLAVVNKGPGLLAVSSVPGELSAQSILADFLIGKLRPPRGATDKSMPPSYRNLEPLPVHRLDQYTSGVFCLATNPKARQHLIDQLIAHTMRREYVAYVEGRPTSRKGTWRDWLEPTPDELRQIVVSETHAIRVGPERVREAITHYEVIDEFPLNNGERFITKLRLRLETGRKHQIRAQAANAGVPLVGDRGYNPDLRRDKPLRPVIEFPRQALHAQKLSLEHPDTPGKRMAWIAGMPRDLKQLESMLRSGRVTLE
jgi:23S rRNA pseudouridine1911/1915/1917 synthase